MNFYDEQLKSLKDQIDRLKEEGVDKCLIPSIYIHTFQIASIVKTIDSNKLNENQKKVFNELDEETLKQFRRLSEGRCSCKISKNI